MAHPDRLLAENRFRDGFTAIYQNYFHLQEQIVKLRRELDVLRAEMEALRRDRQASDHPTLR